VGPWRMPWSCRMSPLTSLTRSFGIFDKANRYR